MTEIRGQHQLPAQDASFLHRDSVAGRKIQFVENSNSSSGSVTIASGAGGVITVGLKLYPPDLAAVSRTDDNVIAFNKNVAWIYTDIFIDTNNNFTYALGSGSVLSAEQKKVIYGGYYFYTPVTNYSQTFVMNFYNAGSSSHTVYVTAFWKFIRYGEDNI